MPEHAHYRGDEIVNPETHHEESDVNVRALIWSFVIFVVFAAVTHVLLYLQFHVYAKFFRSEPAPPMTAMQRPADMSVPPSPRLQPFPTKESRGEVMPPTTNTPVTDMEQMRAAEEQALNNPGWIDRQKGIVRIPIETAKQLVLQRGLPTATAAPAMTTVAGGATGTTSSNTTTQNPDAAGGTTLPNSAKAPATSTSTTSGGQQ